MSTTAPQPPGLRVGAYRLLTQIGEGGMGVVHLAQAPDGRRVALKVLRPHIVGDREGRERLAREVSSLKRVRSTRVAEIIDADPWGATPFVATRYVPGLSLHQHVREEGTIAGDDLRWFAACLAEAVIAVHTVGVLHRDIKPSNVLLEGRSPVLIDFGLARLAEDPRLTQPGFLLGTPGYLAPEILFGEDATTASDVHAWAATVAFAALGRAPFGGGPSLAILDRVRRGEHDLTGVPAELRPLLEASLAPDPLDRPETASVLAALRPHPQDSPTTIPLTVPQWSPQQPTPTRRLTTPVAAPARAPYMQPAPPQQQTPGQPAPGSYPAGWRPLPKGLAKVQRGGLLLGLFALVSAGFTRAPYLSLMLLAVVALAVRAVSWTTEAARERTYRRGRRSWYDGPLAVATSPWYLVVATGGTLMLLAWAVFVTLAVGVAYSLFGLPIRPGLGLMGATLAVSLWWGPGSRRIRVPVRSVIVVATSRSWLGWLGIAALASGVLLCLYGIASAGVIWDPADGSPWRAGTLLGDLVRWL